MMKPRTKGGTGLGLSICSKQVGVLGGRIGAHSCPDKGSVFWFKVPVGVIKRTGGDSDSPRVQVPDSYHAAGGGRPVASQATGAGAAPGSASANNVCTAPGCPSGACTAASTQQSIAYEERGAGSSGCARVAAVVANGFDSHSSHNCTDTSSSTCSAATSLTGAAAAGAAAQVQSSGGASLLQTSGAPTSQPGLQLGEGQPACQGVGVDAAEAAAAAASGSLPQPSQESQEDGCSPSYARFRRQGDLSAPMGKGHSSRCSLNQRSRFEHVSDDDAKPSDNDGGKLTAAPATSLAANTPSSTADGTAPHEKCPAPPQQASEPQYLVSEFGNIRVNGTAANGSGALPAECDRSNALPGQQQSWPQALPQSVDAAGQATLPTAAPATHPSNGTQGAMAAMFSAANSAQEAMAAVFSAANAVQAMLPQDAAAAAAAGKGVSPQQPQQPPASEDAAKSDADASQQALLSQPPQRPASPQQQPPRKSQQQAPRPPSLLQPPSSSQQLQAAWDMESLKGKKALLAEDNLINQTVALKMLKMLGMEASVASNGQEAVAAVQKAQGEPCCRDLLVLFVNADPSGMPPTSTMRFVESDQNSFLLETIVWCSSCTPIGLLAFPVQTITSQCYCNTKL